jgi:hypothetical protein
MPCVRFLAIALCAVCIGCAKTPQQKFTGKWKGAPDVREEVARSVKEAAAGKNLPEDGMDTVEQLSQFAGKVASRMSMGMEAHLQSDGKAIFSGHTEIIGLKGDVAGTWTLPSPDGGHLKLGSAEHQVEGKVVWRDDDAFFFQYEAPYNAPTELGGPPPVAPVEGEEPPKSKLVTLLFRKYLTE